MNSNKRSQRNTEFLQIESKSLVIYRLFLTPNWLSRLRIKGMKYPPGTMCCAMTANLVHIRTFCMAPPIRSRTEFAIQDFTFIPVEVFWRNFQMTAEPVRT